MTNKYLMKIAASVSDEKDTAKTFGKAWVAGHAGTLAGVALGGLAMGTRPGRAALGRLEGSSFGRKVQGLGKKVVDSRIGQATGKVFGNKKGPAAAGALAGGIIGGDVGDYLGIRHGVLEAKKNKSNDK